MFVINEDLSMYVTRGDVATFNVSAKYEGADHVFRESDVIRFKVFGKRDCSDVVLTKDVKVPVTDTVVVIDLDGTDTKIGDVISKPTDYWYEVELNPDTYPQTIIGYDDNGAKLFRLFPEGAEV